MCDRQRDLQAVKHKFKIFDRSHRTETATRHPGYFLAVNQKEMQQYCNSLMHRLGEIYKFRCGREFWNPTRYNHNFIVEQRMNKENFKKWPKLLSKIGNKI